MCISKVAVDWWKLVGIRRLMSGYFSGLETYWMMLFMLRHELSLDSSVIIYHCLESTPRLPAPAASTPLEFCQHTSATGCLLLVSAAKASL